MYCSGHWLPFLDSFLLWKNYFFFLYVIISCRQQLGTCSFDAGWLSRLTHLLTCVHTPGPQQVWSRWALQQNHRFCHRPWAALGVCAARVRSTMSQFLSAGVIQAQTRRVPELGFVIFPSSLSWFYLPSTGHVFCGCPSFLPLLKQHFTRLLPLNSSDQCTRTFFPLKCMTSSVLRSASSFSLLLLDDLGVIPYSTRSPGVSRSSLLLGACRIPAEGSVSCLVSGS